MTSAVDKIVTIDGPSGSGKGTVASLLAKQLGWHLLDSGAIYRIVALAALEQKCDLACVDALTALVDSLTIEFKAAEKPGESTTILLDGKDVSRDIRSEDVAKTASKVAALEPVRAALLALQQNFYQPPGLIADGRDMGTVVFPAAPVKIYLSASAEARAERRYKQLQSQGKDDSLAALLADIKARDERDMNRAVAPLKPAADAIIIDSTELSIEQVLTQVSDAIAKAF